MLHFGDASSAATFVRLFRTVLLKGAFVASQHAGKRVPRRFAIDVRGGSAPGAYDDVETAALALFRADGLFFRRIDLAVGEIVGERARAIVVVSPEPPCRFADTWNKPEGYGPFRLVRYESLFGG